MPLRGIFNLLCMEEVSVQETGRVSSRKGTEGGLNVRLNADNSNKKAVGLFWLVFALFEIVVLITSNFTPEAFIFKMNQSELADTKHSQCQNPVEFNFNGMLSCQTFSLQYPKLGLIMRDLSPLNQFAEIDLLYLPKAPSQKPLSIEQEFKIQLLSLTRKQVQQNENNRLMVFTKGQLLKTITSFSFSSSDHQLQQILLTDGSTRTGYEVKLGYYRQFSSEDQLLVITFLNLKQDQLDNYDILTKAMLVNTSYTQFIIVLRALFLVGMLVTFVIFVGKYNIAHRPSFEAKGVLGLSVFGILFNDPFYLVEVYYPNLPLLFVSTSLVAAFFVALLLSWICMLQKIEVQSQNKTFFMSVSTMWTYSGIAGTYFCLLLYFLFQISYYSFTESPIVPIHSSFNILYMATFALSCLIFLYIGWLYFRITQEWNNVLWRHKIYVTFNIFFILLNLLFISLGWFSVYYESSQKFQIFYASMNFYIVYLQFMYSEDASSDFNRGENRQELNQESQSSSKGNQMGFVTIDLDENQDEVNQFASNK